MRRKLYVTVCIVLFSAIMFGFHEFLRAVIYGIPLWAGVIFTGFWMAILFAVAFWMERRKIH